MAQLSTMEHVQIETGHIDDQYTLMDSLKEKKCRDWNESVKWK